MNCYLHTYLSTPPAFNILGIHHLDAYLYHSGKAEEGFYFLRDKFTCGGISIILA